MSTVSAIATRCTTCRGWSCMKCADAVEHDVCAMDCPDCHDPRMLMEQPWVTYPRKTRPKKVSVTRRSDGRHRTRARKRLQQCQAPHLQLILGLGGL